jgi:protein gp37
MEIVGTHDLGDEDGRSADHRQRFYKGDHDVTVPNSKISWCTGTLNLTVGCTRVSAACDHCYADITVNRVYGGGFFEQIRYFPQRLEDLRKFAPGVGADGLVEPKMVFVNSLSDFWHESIPERFIHQALDAFEQHPKTIIQILTKRPGRMRRVIEDRYRAGVPAHFWLGVTAEDNRVKRMLDIMRGTKERVGEFTAFTSVEPITAPADELDFTGLDWVLTGGESGPKARPMQFAWLEAVHDKVLEAGIALHFKQYGSNYNSPVIRAIMAADGVGVTRAFNLAVERGLELAPEEKGGATYKGKIYNDKPPAFHQLKEKLNAA